MKEEKIKNYTLLIIGIVAVYFIITLVALGTQLDRIEQKQDNIIEQIQKRNE